MVLAVFSDSGEIFVAFSSARSTSRVDLNPLFAATVDATEEAVLNALWHAERTTGREERVVEALPHDEVVELLSRYGRLSAA